MKKAKRKQRKPKTAAKPKRLTVEEKLDLLLISAKEEREHRERIYLELMKTMLRAF
jgi:hypothetical protein